MKKRFLTILLCAVMTLIMAACGSQTGSAGAVVGGNGDAVKNDDAVKNNDTAKNSSTGKSDNKNVSAPVKPSIPSGQAAPETDFEYNAANGPVTITRYLGSDETVFIPSKIGGEDVTKLGILLKKGVFEDNKTLTTVIIPETVFRIENYIFRGCEKLTDVYLPDKLWSIGSGAFMGCSSLKSIYLPEELNEIGVEAFFACTGLTNIYIPDSVTKIGNDAFGKCPNLTVTYKGKTYTQDNVRDLY